MHYILFCLLNCKNEITNPLVNRLNRYSTIGSLISVHTSNAIVNLDQLYAIIIEAQTIYGAVYSYFMS